jgi:hypothetical protein
MLTMMNFNHVDLLDLESVRIGFVPAKPPIRLMDLMLYVDSVIFFIGLDLFQNQVTWRILPHHPQF